MSNPSRGEVTVKVGEREFTLRPTFQYIREIESAIGSIFQLARRLGDGSLGINDMATIIWLGIRKEEPKIRVDDVGDAIVANGSMDYLSAITMFLNNAIDPGRKLAAMGEEKAPMGALN